jgi:Subtilisin-like serine proteases
MGRRITMNTKYLILLFLLFLGFSSAQDNRYVKVLYKDGRVGVVDTKKVPLKSLKARSDVVYVEKPIKLKPLDDIAYSSSVALWGSSNQSISVRTYNGQRLSILHLGTDNVRFSGSCSGSLENLTCSEGTLNLSVFSATDWRLIVQSFGRNLQRSDFSIPSYYIGTGAANTGKTGRNVIIGVIDSGIDWCHPAFIKPDGSSKILYFYEPSTSTEYTKTQIEQFINQGRCDGDGDDDGHGTHVAGIASYIAKDADLIVVRTNFDDADIILGLEYLKEKKDALNRPMVVNMSLGGHIGPHDGTSMLERAIAQYSGRGFVVVVAAGNEGHRKIHAKLNSISSTTSVGINSFERDLIDGWYKNGTLKVELCDASNNCISADPESYTIGNLSGGCLVEIYNTTTSSPLNGDGNFKVYFECTGSLTLKLTPVSGTPSVDLYLASETNEFTNFFLEDGLGGYLGTVGMPGTSPHVITVGALTSRFSTDTGTTDRSFTDLGKIAYFSSRGPTRDGRIKPDVVAPGYFVLGPLAGTTRYILYPGTSMATPVVAGLVALILEDNPNLTVDEVRNILISQALSDDFTGALPNNIYGYGKAFLASIPSSGGDGGSGGSDVGGGGGGGGCSMAQGSFSTLPVLVLIAFLWLRRFVRRSLN